jgi:biopolymer transport protein ExbB
MAPMTIVRARDRSILVMMASIWVCTLGAAIAACRFNSPTVGGDVLAHVDAPVGATDAIDSDVPWLHPWLHRKAFTLLASQIEDPGNGALTNFPVLVSVVDPAIGAVALPSGADIVFTLGDAVTPLATEIEWFARAGQLVAWVKIPSLSATTDTPLYIYYGNTSPPASTADQVWTESFLGVWHLQQSPTAGNGEMLDSSGAHRDGDAEASMTPTDSIGAQIWRGIHLDGVDDFIDFKTADFGNAFTISMWVNANNAADVHALLANSASGNGVDGFRLFVNTVGSTDRRIVFETGNVNTNADHAQTAANAISFGVWTHVTAIVDRAAGSANLYINGARNTERTNTLTDFKVNSDFEIGRMENNFFKFSGALDEVEVASVLRPIEWIRTAFNNQSSPGTFQTPLGTEEAEPR